MHATPNRRTARARTVGNIRRLPTRAAALATLGAGLIAVPVAAQPAAAAAPGGTIVAIQGSELVAVTPDGSAWNVVAAADPLSSVSMANDGTIYYASDERFVDDDTMHAVTQNGAEIAAWSPPNPGANELYGGISDSEIRRDGARIITQSIWSNCNGGGISEICNVRDVTKPGTTASLGDMINENTAAWLGTTNYVIVDGGMSYYRVGDDDSADWFEDTDLSRQWDADAATTADGSVMVIAPDADIDPDPEGWDWSPVLAFYELNGAPPAAPTRTCMIPLQDLVGDDAADWGYLDNVSFSPAGDAVSFSAGADYFEQNAYVVDGLNTDTCAYDGVTELLHGGVTDVYWGHFGYDPDHGPADPGNPGGDPDPIPEGAVIVPVSPARFWDTRPESTFDGDAVGTGRVAGGTTYAVQIAGRGKVPTGAAGVVANLTVVGPDGPGFATLYPCTATPPTASHVNYTPGAVTANNAVVPLDSEGQVCVFTKAGADFVLDVNGFVPAESELEGITPARYLDTRPGAPTFDGSAAGAGIVAGGTFLEVPIAGRGDVPAGAAAALVNVTAVGPDGPGFVTLYPCGTRPGTSTLNYSPNEIVPNGALVNLSAEGTLCAYTKASSHLLIDVAGYVPAGATELASIVPARLADTRPGQATVDGAHAGTGRLAADGVIEVQVAGRGTVPAGASAAFFNVTVVGPDGPGYVTLYPCGTRPTTSNVNHSSAGVVRANNAMTQLSADGTVCLYAKAGTDLVLDVTGWVG